MDLNRAYAGSAFTDYYGAQNPYYTMSYPANYSRPAFGVNAGGYDVHAAGGPGIASCTSTFSQTAAVPKPYVAEPLQTAPPPWPTFPSTWDPSKMEGLNLRIPEGAQGILAGAPQKRKRKTTPSQRLAANIRERRRMCNLNTAFDRLRRRVPAFPHEKRLSRIQTLRLSIMYISFMTEMLSGQDIRTIMKSRNIDPTKPIVWQPYGNDENGGGSFVA